MLVWEILLESNGVSQDELFGVFQQMDVEIDEKKMIDVCGWEWYMEVGINCVIVNWVIDVQDVMFCRGKIEEEVQVMNNSFWFKFF